MEWDWWCWGAANKSVFCCSLFLNALLWPDWMKRNSHPINCVSLIVIYMISIVFMRDWQKWIYTLLLCMNIDELWANLTAFQCIMTLMPLIQSRYSLPRAFHVQYFFIIIIIFPRFFIIKRLSLFDSDCIIIVASVASFLQQCVHIQTVI